MARQKTTSRVAEESPSATLPEDAIPFGRRIPPELIAMIVEEHQSQQFDAMGKLHNQFVAYIAASNVALPNVITVLTLLLHEATQLAKQRYMGEM